MNCRIGFIPAVALMVIIAGGISRNSHGSEELQGKKLIDKVIAVVEDKALLQSEFEIEYTRLLLQVGNTENLDKIKKEKIRKEVLDGLVADLLMAVHAERTGIEITQESWIICASVFNIR